MGSIQEPSAMSIEMASGSESRNVKMQDAEPQSHATGTPSNDASDKSPGSYPHVTNGHLTSVEKTSKTNQFDSLIPIPSVEKDDDGSPSTAVEHEENTSPSVEAGRKENITQSSPARPQHESSQASRIQITAQMIKLNNDMTRLNEVLSQTSSKAAQRVLREKWRLFLFDQYDENHISFILRAGFKNANPSVIDKVVRDNTIFRDQFLNAASKKSSVIEKVVSNASVSDLSHVPQQTLDKVLAERLKTVSARQLIKWLAEADRLGYKLDDILDEDDESVVPNISTGQSEDADMADEVFEVEPPPPQPQQRLASSNRDPLLVEQEKNLAAQWAAAAAQEAARQQQRQQQRQFLPSRPQPPPSQSQSQSQPQSRPVASSLDGIDLKCPECNCGFPNISGYNYHIAKKLCQKQAAISGTKWWCDNCVQAFATKQGMDYHIMNKVCLGEDIAPATSPSSQLRREAQSQSRSQPPPQSYTPPTGPILPPQRPPLTSQPPPSQSTPAIHNSPYSQSRPQVVVQRPPLHTPAPASASTPTPSASTPGPKKQSIPDDVRHSPSELSPERLAALDKELQDAEDRYQQQITEIPDDYTEEQRVARMVSLKNANASRKSQIRKAHGVSLRLREKDKAARNAAGITPGRPQIENRPAQPLETPTSTPPASSFSAVNAPPRSGPSPSNYDRPDNLPYVSTISRFNRPDAYPALPASASQYKPPVSSAAQYKGPSSNPPPPPTASQYNVPHPNNPSRYPVTVSYKPPPLNAKIRVQNLYSEPHPSMLTHALERPVTSGFGVMRVQDLNPQTSHTNTNSNKRRRSPEDDGPDPPRTSAGPSASNIYFAPNLFDQDHPAARPPNRSYSPASSMMQVRAEDAASKMARKTPLAEGQAQSSPSEDRDTPMMEAPPTSTQNPAGAKTNTKETAIMIIDSSDSEDELRAVAATRRVRPVTRNLEKGKEEERRKESEKYRDGGREREESGGDSAEEEDEVTRDEERREKERREMRHSRRVSSDVTGSGSVRRGFMAKRGGRH